MSSAHHSKISSTGIYDTAVKMHRSAFSFIEKESVDKQKLPVLMS